MKASGVFERSYRFLDRYKWIFLFLAIGILFISHLYWDLIITTRHSMNFMDSLFNGSIREFYFDNVDAATTNPEQASGMAAYDISIYIVMGIWNLPLLLLENIGIDPFQNTVLLFWSKLLLLAVAGLAIYLLYKICLFVGLSPKLAKWGCFLFASSSLVIFPLLVNTQYDIFSITISLGALFFYLKEEYKKWLILTAIAISFKLFALFIFVPLLLLREKRVPHILLKIVAVLLPVVLLRTLIPTTPETGELFKAFLGFLDQWSIDNTGAFPSVPLFFVFSLALWIFCFVQKVDLSNRKYSLPVFVCFISYVVFFLTSRYYPYWIILMTPYLYILVVLNAQNLRTIILLESFLSAAQIFLVMTSYNWTCSFLTIRPSIWGALFPFPLEHAKYGFLVVVEKLFGSMTDFVCSVGAAVFFCCLIVLSVYLFPKKTCVLDPLAGEHELSNNKALLLVRSLVTVGVCLLPLLSFFGYALTR